MNFFNNPWFRWFAGGSLSGVSLVLAAKATNKIKDLKVESVSRRFVFSENQTWALFGALVGLAGGILGLGMAAAKPLAAKAFNSR